LSRLGKSLKRHGAKSELNLEINEGDLFKTAYYEDINESGRNIEQRIDIKEFERSLKSTPE
jgi:hypothetical protein